VLRPEEGDVISGLQSRTYLRTIPSTNARCVDVNYSTVLVNREKGASDVDAVVAVVDDDIVVVICALASLSSERFATVSSKEWLDAVGHFSCHCYKSKVMQGIRM